MKGRKKEINYSGDICIRFNLCFNADIKLGVNGYLLSRKIALELMLSVQRICNVK